MHHYILDDQHKAILVDMWVWAEWFEHFENRQVAESFTEFHRISTVFLGLDHSFGNGPPLLFETMVFEREGVSQEMFGKMHEVFPDVDIDRYTTWEEAQAGHAGLVATWLSHEREAAALMFKSPEWAKF